MEGERGGEWKRRFDDAMITRFLDCFGVITFIYTITLIYTDLRHDIVPALVNQHIHLG